MLSSKYPMFLAVGPELRMLYNDAYRVILGDKHPFALGERFDHVWREIWDVVGPLTRDVVESGVPSYSADLPLFMNRAGYLEETYFTFSYSPFYDDLGAIDGLFCACVETTDRVLGERRMRAIRDVSDSVRKAVSDVEVCRAGLASLAGHPDVPFAAVYLTRADGSADLAASTGLWSTNRSLPARWLAADLTEPFAKPGPEGRLIEDIADLVGPVYDSSVGPEPCDALVLPLADAGGPDGFGWMVMAANPRRQLDAEYRQFYELLAQSISGGLATMRTFELEHVRAERLAELDRAKTIFFSNVTHEFRTPITLMLGPLQDALDDPESDLGDTHRERVSLAHRNGMRLMKLVNSLLDVARLEAGRLAAVYAPTDLPMFTADLAAAFRSSFERAGLTFVVEMSPLPEPVHVDADMWEKIVFNLLSNALKYTPNGSVRLLLHRDDSAAVLQVIDTGIGIAPEDRERLFERFHRLDRAGGRTAEGTGIGLALVKEMVELHGGTIGVEAAPEVGSTFTVRIPFGTAHVPDDQTLRAARTRAGTAHMTAAPYLEEVERWLPSASDSEVRSINADSSGVRILVVDDNADMRKYLKRVLGAFWHVEVARNGTEALRRVAAHPPALVISDVMMPDLDGVGLVRALRAEPRSAQTAIVLLSARAGTEAALEGLEAGADDYLVKPFSSAALIGRVNVLLDAVTRREALGEANRVRTQQLSRLSALAAAMTAAQTTDDTVTAIWQHGQEHFGFSTCGIAAGDRGAETLRLVSSCGPSSRPSRYQVLPPARAVALARSIQTEEPVFTEYTAAFPLFDSTGQPTGALDLTWDTAPLFDDQTRSELVALVALAETTWARVRTFEFERLVADELQHSLLELRVREPFGAYAAHYLPASARLDVGGDWYDIVELDDRRTAFAVGDVVGSGLASAVVMGRLRSAFAVALINQPTIESAICSVERFVHRDPGASSSTAAICVFDGSEAQLHYAKVGHLAPIVVSPTGDIEMLDGALTVPLGIHTDHAGLTAEAKDHRPGSLLLMYTDGLVERRGEPLDIGVQRLRDALQSRWHLPVRQLCDALLGALVGGIDRHDDVALLAVRTVGSGPRNLTDAFPAHACELDGATRRLRGWLDRQQCGPTVRDTLTSAIGEACSDAIAHASTESDTPLRVEACRDDEAWTVSVSDSGRWLANAVDEMNPAERFGGARMRDHSGDVQVHSDRYGTSMTITMVDA
jgi:signal transduction histidine kinase/serine phosphatase RsbU (regulator of sigma subunit)/FixJ family two-component response regulator